MKLFSFPRLSLVAVLMALVFASPGRAQDTRVLDEIVAVVDDQIILRSDVDGFVAGLVRQQDIPYSKELWNDALNQMINEKVLTIHAKRDTTIQVTDAQVEQSLDQRIQQMIAQLGSQQRLEDLYGKSIIEIKADLREEFRDQMLAEQFRGRKLREIKITPSEVREWFNRFPADSLPVFPEVVRLAHIVRFPDVTDEAREEAREIITAIRDSIVVGGASFEEMAQLFSDDPGSAANGGRYESMRLKEVVPEFAAVAARAPVGQISQVFETQFGLHILRVNKRLGDVIDYNHILIAFDESKSDPTEAIAYLSAVRDSILTHDMPFGLMARRHSQEEASKLRGGRVLDPQSGERDLILEALGPDWRATIRTLEVGQISEPAPVELLNGRKAYHIVKLEKHTPAHRVNIETDYEIIQQYALREKQNRVLGEWIDRLRKDVYIDIRGEASDDPMASN